MIAVICTDKRFFDDFMRLQKLHPQATQRRFKMIQEPYDVKGHTFTDYIYLNKDAWSDELEFHVKSRIK